MRITNFKDIKITEDLDIKGKRIKNIADPVSDQDVATKKYVAENAGGGTGNIEFITPDSIGGVENSTAETDILNWTIPANNLADGEGLEFTFFFKIGTASGTSYVTLNMYAGNAYVQVSITNTGIFYASVVPVKLYGVRYGNTLRFYTNNADTNAIYPTGTFQIFRDTDTTIKEIAGLDFTADLAMKLTATLSPAAIGTLIAISAAEIKHIKKIA